MSVLLPNHLTGLPSASSCGTTRMRNHDGALLGQSAPPRPARPQARAQGAFSQLAPGLRGLASVPACVVDAVKPVLPPPGSRNANQVSAAIVLARTARCLHKSPRPA